MINNNKFKNYDGWKTVIDQIEIENPNTFLIEKITPDIPQYSCEELLSQLYHD